MNTALNFFHRLAVAATIAAAANIVFLMARGGSYDLGVGLLHAQNAFKPLLILTSAFLAAILLAQPRKAVQVSHNAWAPAVLAAVTALALTFSCTVNPLYDEWLYRAFSAALPTPGSVAHLFVSSQIGVWYRPVGFVSLWVDHALFQDHVWAYHLQNVLLHFANTMLAMFLAQRLGLQEYAARWAGALYLTAAITYEPVMWPSARFDLWAMLFTTSALLASARFLTGRGRLSLMAALACYSLAVASKESGYAFPVLLTVMAWIWPFENKPADRNRRLIELAIGVLIVTGFLLAIREAVLGGTGGYPGTATTPSPHLSFSLATIRIVLTRAMQMSLFSVNLGYPTPAIMLVGMSAFALLLALAAVAGASTAPRIRLLVVYVLAATVPVAPIVSWLDFNAQHVRYLYMPAAFVMMLAAAALANARRPTLLLFAFGLLNLGCGFYDTWVYKATYRHSAELARGIADDLGRGPGGEAGPVEVEIIGMPEEYNGVLFSRFEFEYRLEEMRPGAKLIFKKKGACSSPRCYVWEPAERSLGH